MKAAKLFFILLCLAALIAPAAAAGGSGTASSPYLIATAAELQSINNNLGAYYRLTADIDLAGYTWTPIGTTSAGFFGELDGDGHTIKNLALSRTDQSAGLFRTLTSGATIKDLTLQDCSVTSTSPWCGVLTGSIIMSSSAHETATLQNIKMVRCSVKASDYTYSVGVLCGLCYSFAAADVIECELINCDAETGRTNNVGVFFGDVSDRSSIAITDCTVTYSHAKSLYARVGIFVGDVSSGGTSLIMTNCAVNTCIAETDSSNVGAIAGSCRTGASISAVNCAATNSIAKAKTNYAGGLFGLVDSSGSAIAATGCTVTDCTIVATENYAGGIAGRATSGTTGVFDSCSVSDCTILANSYAATICPAFS